MNNLQKFAVRSFASALCSSLAFAQSTVEWVYEWDRSSPGSAMFADGGSEWKSVQMRMETLVNESGGTAGGTGQYEWVKNTQFTMDVTFANTFGTAESLFVVLTNDAAAPETVDANYAALYFDPDGVRFYATQYNQSPTTSQSLSPFLTGSYSRTTNGGDTTFSLSLDEAQLAVMAAGNGGTNWEGFGYPFDNDGDVTGDEFAPYRLGLWGRSYDAGSVTTGSGSKPSSVRWSLSEFPDIGVFDDAAVVEAAPVPEPAESVLFSLAGIGFLLRRGRRKDF